MLLLSFNGGVLLLLSLLSKVGLRAMSTKTTGTTSTTGTTNCTIGNMSSTSTTRYQVPGTSTNSRYYHDNIYKYHEYQVPPVPQETWHTPSTKGTIITYHKSTLSHMVSYGCMIPGTLHLQPDCGQGFRASPPAVKNLNCDQL